jgi:hypothetical protein
MENINTINDNLIDKEVLFDKLGELQDKRFDILYYIRKWENYAFVRPESLKIEHNRIQMALAERALILCNSEMNTICEKLDEFPYKWYVTKADETVHDYLRNKYIDSKRPFRGFEGENYGEIDNQWERVPNDVGGYVWEITQQHFDTISNNIKNKKVPN